MLLLLDGDKACCYFLDLCAHGCLDGSSRTRRLYSIVLHPYCFGPRSGTGLGSNDLPSDIEVLVADHYAAVFGEPHPL